MEQRGRFADAAVIVTGEGTVSAGPAPPGWPRRAAASRWPTLIRPQPKRWLQD